MAKLSRGNAVPSTFSPSVEGTRVNLSTRATGRIFRANVVLLEKEPEEYLYSS